MVCSRRFATHVDLSRLLAVLAVLFSAGAGDGLSAEDPAVPASAPRDKAAILPISSQITDVTVESLRRRIEEARAGGASVLVFEMDTPGGLVTSSIAIADMIKNLTDVKTVAWVNPNAHSGGTIVAVACDEIVMARSSRMGDSQVILGGPTGVAPVPKELQAKAYTPVLAEFRASCRLRGYDQELCEAFVLPEREVWWVQNVRTGKRDFVFREEKRKRLGEGDDAGRSDDGDASGDADRKTDSAAASQAGPAAEQPGDAAWKLVEKYYDPLLEMEVDTSQPIVRDDRLLEMSAGEAQAYGFSRAIVADEAALVKWLHVSSADRLAPSWSEGLAFWLTSIYVRGFLLVIILLGAYVEFHTPGVGVPGLVALICLTIFVGAPYLTGLANIWEILFLVVGFVLLALEVLVIPGFGVAGISGIVLLVVGLVATFVPDEPGRWFPLFTPNFTGTVQYLKVALITVVSAMAASLIGMVMLSRFLPQMPLFGRIVPANPMPSEVQTEDEYRGLARVGDTGTCVGPLRPAGKAQFGALLVDVVTRGEYIEPQTRVEIIERRGNHVVVRAVG